MSVMDLSSTYMVHNVLRGLHNPGMPQLPAPQYNSQNKRADMAIVLAVSSMRSHMTDEGHQFHEGLRHAGYTLWGYGYKNDEINVRKILNSVQPDIVVVQDKREWDAQGTFREPEARFAEVECMAERDQIFRLTVIKDAHQKPAYHMQSAREMGVHGWITYYDVRIVNHLAPYTRPRHTIRIYHTIDSQVVPPFNRDRGGALLSGATGVHYPLRTTLIRKASKLPEVNVLAHPGYHRRGSHSPHLLHMFNQHKVAICTASIYGYALRKMVEATASGCIVLTDLPVDDVLPEIDDNLVRVHPTITPQQVAMILKELYKRYDYDQQEEMAERAKRYFDYRVSGLRLAHAIEQLRQNYGATNGRSNSS